MRYRIQLVIYYSFRCALLVADEVVEDEGLARNDSLTLDVIALHEQRVCFLG